MIAATATTAATLAIFICSVQYFCSFLSLCVSTVSTLSLRRLSGSGVAMPRFFVWLILLRCTARARKPRSTRSFEGFICQRRLTAKFCVPLYSGMMDYYKADQDLQSRE